MAVACLSITAMLWLSLSISGGDQLLRTTHDASSAVSVPGNVGSSISSISSRSRSTLYQCRAADRHLMCPTCTGTSLEECEKRQRLQPCQTETERCATIKVFDVRGVLEILKKGCQAVEVCGPPTANPSYTGHCDSGKEDVTFVRCVKCDDSVAGTCLPGGASFSSTKREYTERTSLLRWQGWMTFLLRTTTIVVVLVVVVTVAMAIRRCRMTQSYTVHSSRVAQKRWPRFTDSRNVSFA